MPYQLQDGGRLQVHVLSHYQTLDHRLALRTVRLLSLLLELLRIEISVQLGIRLMVSENLLDKVT